MLFEIVTLFPQTFDAFFKMGLIGKAVLKKIITYQTHNPRDHGLGAYRHVDDYPLGGGAGMLLKPDVMEKVMAKVLSDTVILMTPRGRVLKQKMVNDLSKKKSLCIVCGQYEGFDWRWIKQYISLEVSIGDYVLNSGETASKALIEALARKQANFMNKEESHIEESFAHGLLEEDQFTRPTDWVTASPNPPLVPSVLVGGNFKKIQAWKKQNALFRTWERRPDLLKEYSLSPKDLKGLYCEINKKFASEQSHQGK